MRPLLVFAALAQRLGVALKKALPYAKHANLFSAQPRCVAGVFFRASPAYFIDNILIRREKKVSPSPRKKPGAVGARPSSRSREIFHKKNDVRLFVYCSNGRLKARKIITAKVALLHPEENKNSLRLFVYWQLKNSIPFLFSCLI
ncbi:MAG: hypothetical protein ACTHNG_13470 [Ginsengibacter sp.]